MTEDKKKSIDELQEDVKNELAPYFRTVFSRDQYQGRIQAITVISNKETGKIDVVSNNVHLNQDAKKLLREAHDSIDRGQLLSAFLGALEERDKHKRIIT